MPFTDEDLKIVKDALRHHKVDLLAFNHASLNGKASLALYPQYESAQGAQAYTLLHELKDAESKQGVLTEAQKKRYEAALYVAKYFDCLSIWELFYKIKRGEIAVPKLRAELSNIALPLYCPEVSPTVYTVRDYVFLAKLDEKNATLSRRERSQLTRGLANFPPQNLAQQHCRATLLDRRESIPIAKIARYISANDFMRGLVKEYKDENLASAKTIYESYQKGRAISLAKEAKRSRTKTILSGLLFGIPLFWTIPAHKKLKAKQEQEKKCLAANIELLSNSAGASVDLQWTRFFLGVNDPISALDYLSRIPIDSKRYEEAHQIIVEQFLTPQPEKALDYQQLKDYVARVPNAHFHFGQYYLSQRASDGRAFAHFIEVPASSSHYAAAMESCAALIKSRMTKFLGIDNFSYIRRDADQLPPGDIHYDVGQRLLEMLFNRSDNKNMACALSYFIRVPKTSINYEAAVVGCVTCINRLLENNGADVALKYINELPPGDIYYDIGKCFTHRNKPLAFEYFGKVPADSKNYAKAITECVKCALEEEDTNKAIEYAKKLPETSNQLSEIYFYIANFFLHKEDTEKLLYYFDKVSCGDTNPPDVKSDPFDYYQLANVLCIKHLIYKKGDSERALAYANKLYHDDCHRGDAFFLIGEFFLQKGDPASAFNCFDKVINHCTNHEKAVEECVSCSLMVEDYDRAVEQCVRCLLMVKDYDRAVEYASKVRGLCFVYGNLFNDSLPELAFNFFARVEPESENYGDAMADCANCLLSISQNLMDTDEASAREYNQQALLYAQKSKNSELIAICSALAMNPVAGQEEISALLDRVSEIEVISLEEIRFDAQASEQSQQEVQIAQDVSSDDVNLSRPATSRSLTEEEMVTRQQEARILGMLHLEHRIKHLILQRVNAKTDPILQKALRQEQRRLECDFGAQKIAIQAEEGLTVEQLTEKLEAKRAGFSEEIVRLSRVSVVPKNPSVFAAASASQEAEIRTALEERSKVFVNELLASQLFHPECRKLAS